MQIIFNGAVYNLTGHLNMICLILPSVIWAFYVIAFFWLMNYTSGKKDEKSVLLKLSKFIWIPSISSTLYFINPL
jgi:hypothetical protein